MFEHPEAKTGHQADKKTRTAKLAGMLAVPRWRGRRPGCGGTGCGASERGASERDAGASLPMLSDWHRQLGCRPTCEMRLGQVGGAGMTLTTRACRSYTGFCFPAEIISHAVWLYLHRRTMMNGSARN